MPTIKDLSQLHPSCNRERNEQLRALYEGGERFVEELDDFLPKRQREPGEQYALRRKEAAYRNYTGPIVDYFAALLFTDAPAAIAKREDGTEVVETDEYYSRFQKDCDRLGADLSEAFKQAITDAMQVQRAWLWVQHPSAEAETRAEFDELKIGESWLTLLKDEDVLDWETDDKGRLAWVLTFERTSKRQSLSSGRKRITKTWRHIQQDRVDVYSIEFEEGNEPPDTTEVPQVATYPHRYQSVPVVCLELKPALWVVSRLASPQLGHFRLSAMQLWGMSRTCYAMPIFKRDTQEDQQPTLGAGYGIYLGIRESLEWAAPPVDCYEALASEIKSHKDEIYRIAHTMALGVENNAAAVGRSAESKQTDAQATAVVVRSYAKVVRENMERVYDLVSRARGDKYTWSISGLDDYSAGELPALVDTLERVEGSGGIPSKTWQVEMRSRIAESTLPDLDQVTKQKIRKELEAGIEDQSAQARNQREEQRMNAISKSLKNEPPKVLS